MLDKKLYYQLLSYMLTLEHFLPDQQIGPCIMNIRRLLEEIREQEKIINIEIDRSDCSDFFNDAMFSESDINKIVVFSDDTCCMSPYDKKVKINENVLSYDDMKEIEEPVIQKGAGKQSKKKFKNLSNAEKKEVLKTKLVGCWAEAVINMGRKLKIKKQPNKKTLTKIYVTTQILNNNKFYDKAYEMIKEQLTSIPCITTETY